MRSHVPAAVMRIALCLSSLPLSGVGTSVGIVHDGLKAAGHEVSVLLTGDRPGADLAYARSSGWNVTVVATGERYLRKRLQLTLESIQRGGYDVVLNNTSIETQLVLPCLPEQVRRACVLRGLNASALRHVALNSAWAHAVIGISQEMVRVLKEDARVRAPVWLIPNCTRVMGGAFPRLDARLEVCYLGRLSASDKNVLVLPEIARHLKLAEVDFRLRIAGDGPAEEPLRRRVAELELAGIEFCGAVTREAAMNLLQTSHFCLLPSASEGLSNVLLECMALGCVPVCSDIENFKWVLGEASPRLQCRLREAADYAQCILALRSQPDDYQALQQHLRRRQQEHFTPQRTVSGYLDLLQELVRTNGRRLPPRRTLSQLRLPLKFQLWCSPLWRTLQILQDAISQPSRVQP